MNKYRHLKSDFEQLKAEARELPGVTEYLDGPEVAVGQMILARQLELGYTQQQLADLAGVPVGDIAVIQAGLVHSNFGCDIQPDSLSKLFKALKIVGVQPIIDDEQAATSMII